MKFTLVLTVLALAASTLALPVGYMRDWRDTEVRAEVSCCCIHEISPDWDYTDLSPTWEDRRGFGFKFTWSCAVVGKLQNLNIREILKGVEDSEMCEIPDTSKAIRSLGLEYRTCGRHERHVVRQRQDQK
ncbi:hypothetical protein CALVIDRAFT_528873 [Calocera viscosa TUFC12733]|uniref:Uncharacterized protein n=1 Tax=Calocera viscosa (strain TUFC12733) TaxID=1330018 RepID=A0A167K8L4_CALVF|nr:hypothetical protein CALVIDRAFT_528873 [Calocera viscosa TUFC12733]